jgi:acylphosphatase
LSLPIRRRVIVHGRVQGVWFRGSTLEQARHAGLGGWVKNLADGRVEAVFEGDDLAVEEVVAWCERGPRHADVERVEVFEEEPQGEGPFRVRH